MKHAQNQWYQEHGCAPRLSELAEITGFTERHIQQAFHAATPSISIDEPFGNIGDGEIPLSDYLPDTDGDGYDGGDVEGSVLQTLLREDIADVLPLVLTAKQQTVLCRRFGLFDGPICTLDQIARFLNLTRERVRQIEAKALLKLSQNTEVKRFYQSL